MNVLYEGIRWMIEKAYTVCGDYGIAIVLITVGIRLCMIPLNQKRKRELKQQQKFSSKADEIKNKYKYNKNESRMNEELKKLYQEERAGNMGCLITLLQFLIMIILYNGIRLAAAVNMTTVLLPWVPSLLVKDSTYILPAITVCVQMFPQVIPYIGMFKSLNLQKMSLPMILILLFSNSWFVVILPAGIELYYMVSGLFNLGEQIAGYIYEWNRVRV